MTHFFKKQIADVVLILSLLITTLCVNLYKVDTVTPGVWGDEVTVASTSEEIVENWKSVPFVNTATGYTKPFLYLEGLSIKLFGRTIISIRFLSVLFGSIDVICLYVLLRFLFKKDISFIAASLMAFSYPHLVISRLAYNITAALFFQILTMLFVLLYYKKHRNPYLLGLGLSLGAGLYTYVGFRTFFLIATAISVVMVINQKANLKTKLLNIFLIVSSIFVSASVLLSFTLTQPKIVMARVKSLSVFGQNLPVSEVGKEISSAALRLSYVFLFSGDPSARSNPSGVSMFDIITTTICLVGFIYLFKTNKKIWATSLLLLMSPIVNDIFSLERIPEFHYYGIGHPNTYRVATLFPLIFFWLAWGLKAFKKVLIKSKKYTPYVLAPVAVFLIVINANRYFNQANINPALYRYNYTFNNVKTLKVAEIIKESGLKKVNLSKSFATDVRISYFAGKNTIYNTFDPQTEGDALKIIRSSELTIVDPKDNMELSKKLYADWQENPTLFYMRVSTNPFNEADTLIFSRTD